MDKHIGDRIRERRKALGLNQPELGRLIGRSKGAVSQWESGIAKPDRDSMIGLAKALQCTQEWLLEGIQGTTENGATYRVTSNVTDAPEMSGTVPVISWVAAGGWTEVGMVETDLEQAERMPRPPGASDETFALRVVGESMAPKYRPGTVIYIDPAVQPENGDDVVAVLTDSSEATFKRLVLEPGGPRMLMALNEHWPQRFMEINGNCRIVGTVIADLNLRRR